MRAFGKVSRRRFAASRRGSVIVVVLVTLLLASLMLTKFIENSAVELTLATRQADRNRLRADAYAALETELAVMAEIKAVDDDLYTPAQGWDDPYAYSGESPREGVTVEFAFTDESGKTSLPNMSFDDMVEFAQVLGLGENDARRFSDGLYTWMKSDHTPQEMEAEASRYEREAIPHEPPKRSLRSWDELRAVHVARDYVYDETGALTPFGQALQDNLSLYRFQSTNVNALAPSLGTARGWDETQMGNIASYRAGKLARPPGAPPWFRKAEDVTAILGKNADVEGLDAVAKLVRIDVTVREGAGSMRLSALVAIDKSVRLPSAVSADGSADENNGGQNAGAGGFRGGAGGGGRGNGGGRGEGNNGDIRPGNGSGRPNFPGGTRPPGGGQNGQNGRNGGRNGGQIAPGGGRSGGQSTPGGGGRTRGSISFDLQQVQIGGVRASAGSAPRAGSGSSNRSGAGATTRETSGTGGTSEEKLDYPFTILEVIESAGPAPAPAAVEAEEAPRT